MRKVQITIIVKDKYTEETLGSASATTLDRAQMELDLLCTVIDNEDKRTVLEENSEEQKE